MPENVDSRRKKKRKRRILLSIRGGTLHGVSPRDNGDDDNGDDDNGRVTAPL